MLAVGIAVYLGAHTGAGPAEAAALAWDPPVPFRWSYSLVQGGGALVGWLLGATIGVGTIAVIVALVPPSTSPAGCSAWTCIRAPKPRPELPPRIAAMAEITRDELAHLATLARIDLSDAELDHLAPQLSVILDSVASIRAWPATTSRPPRTRCR